MKKNNTDLSKMLNNASLAIKKKNYNRAIEICQKVLNVSPDDKKANYLTGLAYKSIGQNDKAIQFLEKTLSFDPKNGLIYAIIGDIYLNKKQLDEALNNYTFAINNDYSTDKVYNAMGTIWKKRGDDDIAFKYFQKALNLNPDFTATLQAIGMIYLHKGKKEDVVKTMTHLIKLDPHVYRAYYMLARSQKYKEHTDITRKMEALFSDPNTSDEGLIFLGYGLGKVYEELGEYEKAFEALKTANTIKRASSKFSINKSIKRFDKLKEKFNKNYVEQIGETGIHDKTPIFIVGMPRSGTSLTEQILSSHPSIYGAGELNTLANLIKKHVKSLPPTEENYKNIGKEYIDELRKIDPETKYIVDKQPANYLHIPYICLALPEAKIIHCVRDPMDTCFSNFKNYFESGRPMSNDLIEVGQDYKLYEDLMSHYHKLFPGKIYDVVYEDLVENQEAESKKLLEFCGVPWDDTCLTYYKNERTVKTMSSVQVRQPIYKDSVKVWKHYEKQLEPLKKILEGKKPMESNKKIVNINGKDYETSSLSDTTKVQMKNIQFAKAELNRLHNKQTLVQTALNSYKKALIDSLEEN